MAALAAAAPGLLAQGSGTSDGPAFALPRGPVVLLGALCAIVFLLEGAALDLSGVFLTRPALAMPPSPPP